MAATKALPSPVVQDVVRHHAAPPSTRSGSLLPWAFSLFALFTLAAAFSPAAKALVVLYPLGALFIAGLAYTRSKPAYLGFVCWLWFLSPLVRRLVDAHTSGTTSPILLGSFAACMLPWLYMISDWSAVITKRTGPILFVLGSIFYGAFVAFMHYRFYSLAQALIAWICPLSFAYFIFHERHHYKSLYHSFERNFLIATLVTGGYGIYQYLFMPSWDALWMVNSGLQSIGQPEPWAVRVFGTMNSPQVFASFLMVGILIALRSTGRLRLFAAPVGLAALILTMSRSGWLSVAAGTLYLCFFITNKQRLQLMGIAIICGLVVAASMENSTINDTFSARFQSFSDTRNDDSFTSRLKDYGTLTQMMKQLPFGAGLGNDVAGGSGDAGGSSAADGGLAARDSSVMTVLLSMGWMGTLVFLLGIGLLAGEIFLGSKAVDPSLTVCRAILFALLVESPLNSIVAGPDAFLIWIAVGFALAQIEVGIEQNHQAYTQAKRALRRRTAVAS